MAGLSFFRAEREGAKAGRERGKAGMIKAKALITKKELLKGEEGREKEGKEIKEEGRAGGGLRRESLAAGSKLCFEYLKWLRNERADEGRREAEEGKEGRRERRGGRREAGMRRKKKTEYAGRTPFFFALQDGLEPTTP